MDAYKACAGKFCTSVFKDKRTAPSWRAWSAAAFNKASPTPNRLAGVRRLQIPDPVARHAVAQRQVLRACRRTQGVSLHKTQALQYLGQGCGREQAACDCMAAKLIQIQNGASHGRIMPQTYRMDCYFLAATQ